MKIRKPFQPRSDIEIEEDSRPGYTLRQHLDALAAELNEISLLIQEEQKGDFETHLDEISALIDTEFGHEFGGYFRDKFWEAGLV